MSKYDNYSKIEEIRRYYSEEDYKAAAELADSVDWRRVKSWDALAMMTDAYENLEEYEYARDMAILAYNRNLGGKKLVYRLTELLIKTGDYDDAEDTFNEYCAMSGNAADSYILEYHLLRAKNAPDKELIRVLEEFKEAGPDERYMYRLAELYAKNGEDKKCAEICDNIALWFKDGDFAEGAVKLKKKVGGELSPEQEKLFTEAKVKDEDLAKTGKVDFKGQVDKEPDASMGAAAKVGAGAAATAAAGGVAAAGAAGKLKSFVKNVFNDEDFDEEAEGISASAQEPSLDKAPSKELKEAKENVTSAGAGSSKHDIDPEIKKTMSAEVSEELDTESALRGDGVIQGEKQIDGQLNMTDWMTDVREKKYGGQSTREYSKTELERMLEEKDEKSEAYDRLMAEQKKLADESGKPFNEASAKRKVELQLAVDAARRDLDIRTGKGTAKQESEAVGLSSAAEERPQEETVLGAVLEAAGTEAVRESAGAQTDPSERMLRIESAVLSLLGARLSEAVAKRGAEAPKDVVNAAALLVKYISGKYDDSKAFAAAPKQEPVTPKEEPVTSKEESVIPKEPKATEESPQAQPPKAEEPAKPVTPKEPKATEETPQVQPPKAEEPAKPVAPKEPKATEESPQAQPPKTESTDKDKSSATAATAAAIGAAGAAAAATGGILHEKAMKAKEIFGGTAEKSEGAKTPETKEPEAVKDAHAEAIKEIKSTPRNTGKTPDLSKMRLKKVTAEDVEANLTDEEAELAQRITSDDRAADVIQKRITAPISTAEVEKALAEAGGSEINFKDEDTFTDTTHIDKKMLREIIESSDGDEDSEGKSTRRFDTTAKQDTAQLDNVLREDLPKGKREKIKSMFDEYYDMPEIDAQIEEYIASLPVEITREDSRNGNIIIAGAESVDKTALAKTLAKAVNISYPKKKKKVIRTTGDNLNQYGFARSADKLRGTFLVIENAGLIKPEVIAEMVDVMRKDTDRMIVIAEDTDAGIESFLNTNPALPKLFNHRINMRPFTTDELVEIAKDLASQKGFTVTDEGALALYLEIDEIRASEPKLTIEDMDALTDDAIAHAKKRIKREMGVNPKKLDEEMSLLTNDDFRY